MPPKAAPRRAATRQQAGAEASAAPDTNLGTDHHESNVTISVSGGNRSQRSATTATPASPGPGPSARPPVQRLQSLKKRPPSGSIAPSAKPSALPGEAAAKPTLKFQPRAVARRSKAEREAIEQLEAERNRERLAEAAAIQRGRGRGDTARAGGGRGRGGALGMGGNGPLGSRMAGLGGRRGRAGRFANDSRASSMSRRSRSIIEGGSGAASRDVSSDESDSGIRMNIDQINLESESEDFDEPLDDKSKMEVKGRAIESEKGLRPIRVERHEHEERVVSVNLESSTSKPVDIQDKSDDDDALFVEQVGLRAEPAMKQEPADEGGVMKDLSTYVVDDLTTTDAGQVGEVRKEPSVEGQPVAPEIKVQLRTKEETEEFERRSRDLQLVKELLGEEPRPRASAVDVDEDADFEQELKEEGAQEDDLTKDKLAGQLFLMQFPPMTPNLIVPGSIGADGSAHPADQAGSSTGGGPAAASALKPAEEVGVEGQSGPQEPSKVVTASDWQLRAGRVGKLNVHASGRVTLDWGGISFEVDRATAVDFLQEALIVSSPSMATETTAEAGEAAENKVWAMGQLSGKFTVTPNWEEIL